MDDRERVAAICARDPQGLASTYEAYASALYTFCRSMLRDEHAAQDAVHDTFVILDVRVGQLRDPDRLGPWLYAIARSQCLRHLRATLRATPTDDLGDVMDQSRDVADDIESTQLQTLVWDAMAGLNSGERAALEMSLRHGLSGADLADALGVSPANAKKLVQRGKDELEKGLGALLLARAPSDCAELVQLTAGWDGRLDPLMRKRLSRHIEHCTSCGERKRREVNASALLAAVPLLAVPVALTRRLRHSMRLVSDEVALGSSVPPLVPPPLVPAPASASASASASTFLSSRERRAIARTAGAFDRAGFPVTRGPVRRNVAPIVAAAAAVAIVIVLIGPARAEHHAATSRLFALSTPVATPSTPPSISASTSASRRGTAPRTSTAAATSATSAVPGSATKPPRVVPGSSEHGSPVTTATTPPTTVPGVLELSSPTLDLGAKAAGAVQLTAKGAPVSWTSAADPGISVKPVGGTTVTSELVTIAIDRTMYPKAGNTVVEFSWPSGKALLSVTWADGP